MDVPGLLPRFEESDSSDIEEDSVFSKYSCTPPSRQAVKLLKKRKDFKVSRTLSYHRPITPDESPSDSDATGGSRSKRHKNRNLLREADRTIKWVSSDMVSQSGGTGFSSGEESPVDKKCNGMKVESRNRFMSLCSRLVKLPKRVQGNYRTPAAVGSLAARCKERARFHLSLCELMKTGNSDEATGEKSEEELLWQNELKDLLWLELQAWISGFTPQQFDEHLLVKRQQIPHVLQKIIDFKFTSDASEKCKGCLCAFCEDCRDQRNKALAQVGLLLEELGKIEALYPSGRALKSDHPLYGSAEFTDCVRAMCLWYNVTRFLQMKIDIIGHTLLSIGSKGLRWSTRTPPWPTLQGEKYTDEGDTKSPPINDSAFHSSNSNSSINSLTSSNVNRKQNMKRQTSRVQFIIEQDNVSEDSPSVSWKSDYSGTDLPESDEGLKNTYITEPVTQTEDVDQSRPTDASPPYSEESTSERRLIYRSYVERALKAKGLRKMLRWFFLIHRVDMLRAKEALRKVNAPSRGNHSKRSSSTSSPSPYDDNPEPWEDRSRTGQTSEELEEIVYEMQRYGIWSPEYQNMNLPSYRPLYLFLRRVPLDVIREALSIRLAEKPEEPSQLSIRQLMQEFKEGLRAGVFARLYFRRDLQAVFDETEDINIDNIFDDKEFNLILVETLDVYLHYLKKWASMALPSGAFHKNALEQEWSFIRNVCPHIPSGEKAAAYAFCQVASSMLRSTGQSLHRGIQESMEIQRHTGESTGENEGEELSEKDLALTTLRRIQSTFHKARHDCFQSVAVTRMFRKDLEIVVHFDTEVPVVNLLDRIWNTEHVRLHNTMDNCVVFIPSFLTERKDLLKYVVNFTARTAENCVVPDLSQEPACNESYIILLPWSKEEGQSIGDLWKGKTVIVETEIAIRGEDVFQQSKGFVLIVSNPIFLISTRRHVQEILGPGLSYKHDNRPSNHLSCRSLLLLQEEVIGLSQTLIDAIQNVQDKCDVHRISTGLEPVEQMALISRWMEVVRQCYKLGFEYHKDVLRLICGRPNTRLAASVVILAQKWMSFATERCDRGRGLRPRWATHGLDFLLLACEPEVTHHLSDDQFVQLKQQINECVSHIIGSAEPEFVHATSSTPNSNLLQIPQMTKSRSPSPALRRSPKLTTSVSVGANISSVASNMNLAPNSPAAARRRCTLDESNLSGNHRRSSTNENTSVQIRSSLPWKDRVRHAVETIDAQWDSRLEKGNLIGRISHQKRELRGQIRLKNVTFSWQRGTKIGQGRFGRVFTAVNNRTGELMAMKEITLQPNDHRTVRSVADELRIFEGIHHRHLVRHYGVEIHRDEMIIFMEFCPEGTLENLVSSTESGLPEGLIRRFTRQLLEAVNVLHENGIVHRDIKGANIFLTDKGHCLKLGDFGCAAKIRANTTMAGELQGFVGTQAYMAPEVFMHTVGEGHGRAADIWSVGCVVIEMSTGKRPWHDLESNYAIMFKVGMGEVPPTPDHLSSEGQEFIGRMLQHEPRDRDTASQLLDHHFLRIYTEEDAWPLGS